MTQAFKAQARFFGISALQVHWSRFHDWDASEELFKLLFKHRKVVQYHHYNTKFENIVKNVRLKY